MGVCCEACFVERAADCGDAAVHHVAGGDDVGAGLGLADGGAGKQLERGIVGDFEIGIGAVARFDDHAAMAVAGVLAEANVGDEDQLFSGCGLLERAQRLLHDAVFIPGAGALLVFCVRQAEKQQAAEAEPRGFFGFAHGFVHREIEDAGHGGDGFANAFAGTDEEGIDQVAGVERSFAHQRAQRLALAHPPHAVGREGHELIVRQRSSEQRWASASDRMTSQLFVER